VDKRFHFILSKLLSVKISFTCQQLEG